MGGEKTWEATEKLDVGTRLPTKRSELERGHGMYNESSLPAMQVSDCNATEGLPRTLGNCSTQRCKSAAEIEHSRFANVQVNRMIASTIVDCLNNCRSHKRLVYLGGVLQDHEANEP